MNNPPKAQIVPKITELHGVKRSDDFYWLRNREDKEVISYLEAENEFTKQSTQHLEGLQQEIYDEMLGRIKEDDDSVPYKKGAYFYYSRTETGKPYRIYCRKKESLDAVEEILVDGNQLAENREYMQLGSMAVSPDHSILAYSVDYEGDERFKLYFRCLNGQRQFEEEISNTSYSLAWSNDNQTIFYTVVDEASRPYKIMRHRLGQNQTHDQLVYHEADDSFFLTVSKSRSDAYIYIDADSAVTSEIRFANANEPDAAFQVFAPRANGVEYDIEHHTDHFYIVTNEDALNFQVFRTPIGQLDKKAWELVIPHDEKVTIDGLDAFSNYLIVYERAQGLPEIRVLDLTSGESHRIPFDDASYSVWSGSNPEFDISKLRFGYSSLRTPDTVYEYDLATKVKKVLKQSPVLGGYNSDEYEDERLWATADDGTQIPISVIYKKNLVRNGEHPALLFGYGSYGYSYDADFDSDLFSLIDRGFVVGIAHVRGGGELGRAWKNAGKFFEKKNTFSDFISCAELLIQQNYTSSDRLAISGRSAGGLLMGAVTNMRPDLFQVVIAGVPFVDVVNTMLDETIPLTVIEWEEWGNPKDKKYFEAMLAYSPYDNVKPAKYPNILVLAGLNDPRVQYWEPAKWTAKLRVNWRGDNVLLLKTEMGAGHGGNSGRYGQLKDTAFEYAFILDRVNK
ncbi:MAG: S9 family peptidase [Myxococcota bacterium]|nr:S9 family peptidase [Myxococcota bacterium]